MDLTLNPISKLEGTVRVPSDKSLTHRAVLFSSLAKGRSVVKSPLAAEDCLSTLGCVSDLGCRVEKKSDEWIIEGKGLWGFSRPVHALDCGNSGTTMRLISGILSAQEFKSELKGDASLSKRPMDRVAKPLQEMGAQFQLKEGKYAPYSIQGTKSLRPIHWKNSVASAQVKSAVLLAALHAEGETVYEEPTLSRDHTERILMDCGVLVSSSLSSGGAVVKLKGPASIPVRNWEIPGDFSSAAFFVAAGLLVKNARVILKSVNLNPTRTGLLTVLRKMGAQIERSENAIASEPMGQLSVYGPQVLKAGKIDSSIAPHLIDEIPIFAVLATQAEGRTVISGVEELRLKESDRLSAMTANLKAMGAKISENSDGLVIDGPTPLRGAVVDSFHDHRIAMSMAVAALIADGPTTIRNAECVAISFPSFWDLLKSISRS